jgi:uncharacterized protein YggE
MPWILASLVSATAATSACRSEPHVVAVPLSELTRPEVTKPGQVVMTGTATLEVSPDCADLTMTLSVENAKPAAATASVEAEKTALVAALARLGVANADLKLSYLSLGPVYDTEMPPLLPGYRVSGVPVLRGYRAEITVTATTRRFEQLGALMEAGGAAGATGMSSRFRRSDLPALKKQVRDMAIAAARDKAKQTADAVGIKLGRVVSFTETSGGNPYAAMSNSVSNAVEVRNSGATLGGALEPLTLEVSIAYELATST